MVRDSGEGRGDMSMLGVDAGVVKSGGALVRWHRGCVAQGREHASMHHTINAGVSPSFSDSAAQPARSRP